jgi:hypothetical protein
MNTAAEQQTAMVILSLAVRGFGALVAIRYFPVSARLSRAFLCNK